MPILNWVLISIYFSVLSHYWILSSSLKWKVYESLPLSDCSITECKRNTACVTYKLQIISLLFKIFSSEGHTRQNLEKQRKGLTWNALFSQLPTWACAFELESHPEHASSTCYFQLTSPVHPPRRFAYSFKENNLIEQAAEEVPIIMNCHTTRLLAKSKVRFFSPFPIPFILPFLPTHL